MIIKFNGVKKEFKNKLIYSLEKNKDLFLNKIQFKFKKINKYILNHLKKFIIKNFMRKKMFKLHH